jgi:hypothetical protein
VAVCFRLVLGGCVVTALAGCLLNRDSKRPVGDPCWGDGQCESALHCLYGRCRQPCTTDRDCGTGAACVPSLENPSIYGCTLPDESGGTTCPDGLSGDGTGVCRRPCNPLGPEPGAPCGPAQTCDQGWCRPSDDVDGGIPGSSDAGVDGGDDGGEDNGSLDSRPDGGPDSARDSSVPDTHADSGRDSSVPDNSPDVGADSRTDAPVDGGVPGALEWVFIRGGAFSMGSADGFGNERPVHEVTVASFDMLRTEVTVEQYGECVAAGMCTVPGTGAYGNWNTPGREDHPVNHVSWQEAVDFCRRSSCSAMWSGHRDRCSERRCPHRRLVPSVAPSPIAGYHPPAGPDEAPRWRHRSRSPRQSLAGERVVPGHPPTRHGLSCWSGQGERPMFGSPDKRRTRESISVIGHLLVFVPADMTTGEPLASCGQLRHPPRRNEVVRAVKRTHHRRARNRAPSAVGLTELPLTSTSRLFHPSRRIADAINDPIQHLK